MIANKAKYFAVAFTVLLSACTQSPTQPTSTSQDTGTTTVTDEATGTKTTTTVEKDEKGASDTTVRIETTGPDDASVNVQSGDETNDTTVKTHDGTVHVRAPGFRLDKDKTTGAMHIRAPFVRIDKSSDGKTRVDVETEH